MKKLRKFEIIIGRISIGLFSIAFLFAILEIQSRVRYTEPSGIASSHLNHSEHSPRPFVMYTAEPGGEINALGYKGPLPEHAKGKEEFRIFVIGGSTVFNGPPSIPDALSELSLKMKKNIKVYNFGIISSVSRQDITRIWIDIAGFQPDLILHYCGGNDTIPVEDPRLNYPHRYLLTEIDPIYQLNPERYDFLLSLALSSHFLRMNFPEFFERYAVGNFLAKLYKNKPDEETYKTLKAKAFVQNLRWGNYFAEGIGAKYLVVLQPQLAFKATLAGMEVRHTSVHSRKYQESLRDLIHQELRKYKEIHYIDISNLFLYEKAEIFSDSIHVKNQETNILVAKEILKKSNLIQSIGIKGKPILKDLISEDQFIWPVER